MERPQIVVSDTAESISIEMDERGVSLVLQSANDGELYEWLIPDPEQLYDRVKGAIGPWLRERDDARASYKPPVPAAFLCDPDESAGVYELSDPKHPDHHSVHADIWDAREGK